MKLYEFLQKDYEEICVLNLKKLKNKTILITGSNGLIGSNLLSFLYFIDKKERLNLKLIAHSFSKPNLTLPRDENITYLNSDLSKQGLNVDFDYLIHAATYAQPKKVLQNLYQSINLNVNSFYELLQRAESNKAKVLFLSSSSIYGEVDDSLHFGIREIYKGNIDISKISSIYGEAKRMGELIAQSFADKIDIKIARIAIAYGPGVKFDDKRFIAEFIKKALILGKIEMMDSGLASRQICYISDAIEMLLNVLLNGKERIYNISGAFYGGYGARIKDIAKIIAKYTNAKLISPKEDKGVEGAYKNVVLDISKYTNEFEKANFKSIDYGIKRSIEYFQSFFDKELKGVKNVK
ncbi:NAD(P)-dependent oxidoreductase [Campylobacter sp. LR291e]|uniref:NAD-dependent epimerase/dehydratase family protein n=1 Tax=Campylobacter sp. LR291e TaxID=2593546 RepID=UPI00123C56E4|nr:NAD(P)-dependent oxidoreductase [Campylobacter sp. LR291e]KAA6233455.1 NAD(P)-dependent oxidoreductase [Campylobacter sp. LR291e]